MKKLLLLFAALVFSAISSFGQITLRTEVLDPDNEYDQEFYEYDTSNTIVLCNKGGISIGGVELYSEMFVNGYRYTADEGFGFCKMRILKTNSSFLYDNVIVEPVFCNYKYAFMHSANQKLIMVRLSEGTVTKVADLGLYKSVLSVYFKDDGSYGYHYAEIIATNTTGGTSNVNFYPMKNAMDNLEEIIVNVDVSSITLDQSSITLEKGSTAQLEATVLPEIATNKNLEWTTSDASVATVKDGLVTGVNAGMAIITAKATDGSNTMAQCIAVVSEPSGIASPKNIKKVEGVYTLDGKKVSTFTKGIYVVRMEDGTTQKVTVK